MEMWDQLVKPILNLLSLNSCSVRKQLSISQQTGAQSQAWKSGLLITF